MSLPPSKTLSVMEELYSVEKKVNLTTNVLWEEEKVVSYMKILTLAFF
jgi:hypothetical protein